MIRISFADPYKLRSGIDALLILADTFAGVFVPIRDQLAEKRQRISNDAPHQASKRSRSIAIGERIAMIFKNDKFLAA